MSHPAKDCLKNVRVLLTPPSAWQKCCYATSAEGFDVAPESPDAVCFCLVGAIRRVCPSADFTVLQCLMETASKSLGLLPAPPDGWTLPFTITRWNDAPSRTHEQVLKTLDLAVELAP